MLRRKFIRNSIYCQRGVHRNYSAALEKRAESVATNETELKNARPYSDIPGPSLYKFFREFLPGGAYQGASPSDFVVDLRRKYGDIVKLPTFPGKKPIILAFDPEIYRTVFRNEGVWPIRHNFEPIEYHRKVHRKDFFDGVEGLVNTSGESWARFRTAVNPILMHPQNAKEYLSKLLEVNSEFLLRIREIIDPITKEVPGTFENELNRLAFESVCVIGLDKQLGLIRRNRDNPEANRLFKNVRYMFDVAYEIESNPISWKLYKTAKFKELMAICDDIVDILMKHINDTFAEIEKKALSSPEDEGKSVLEKLLKVDKKIATVMAMDLLMAGVDMTSSTIAGILLLVAKNSEKQEKLRQELRTILPKKDSQLTLQNMKHLPYLRACIKEGIRLFPVIPGTMRFLTTDLVLGGYKVPKGIGVSIASNLLSRDEKYYPKPDEFLPERWLRSPGANDEIVTPEVSNPFVYVPFGFGPRSCAGKRIADMEMEITLATIVRNFYMGFDGPIENAFKAKFFNVPVIPLKFSFREVED